MITTLSAVKKFTITCSLTPINSASKLHSTNIDMSLMACKALISVLAEFRII